MTAASRPVAIIQTGLPPQPIAERHGDFSGMICRTAGLPPERVAVVAVHAGGTLADPQAYCAAIITGSPAMVSDREAWSEDTAHWLRGAVGRGLPILGICYGHQLLAHALGGVVGYHPRGREVGTQAVELLGDAAAHPLLQDMPVSFPAHLIHQQSVLELPPGARVLARSAHDPHQIVQYGEHVLSTQYHPEFEPDVMQTYLHHYTPRLGAEGFDVGGLMDGLQPTPHARQTLLNFLQRYAA
ncbi:glutamine amidotransferase [Pigmentiphaga soli]|uniref:Glutamine amidotransferase n=1 Tax=Pigmentiphaga soli TaxID=1007095 RepID=A0ABP8HR90_9BURK